MTSGSLKTHSMAQPAYFPGNGPPCAHTALCPPHLHRPTIQSRMNGSLLDLACSYHKGLLLYEECAS